MDIRKKELEKLYLSNEDGVFKPNFLFIEEDEVYYYGFELLKEAEEVYQDWLENKDKVDICEPTLEERLAEAEQKLEYTEQKLAKSEEEKKLLKAQVEANTSTQEFLESCLMEVAKVVYA